jgi:cell division protein FtsB
MTKFISNLKYPLLTFLGIGLLFGVMLAGVFGGMGWQRISELKEEKRELSTKYEQLQREYQVVRAERESLKKKTSKIRIVRPDGEIIEKELSEVESERELAESIKESMRKSIIEELRRESTVTKTSRSISLGVGRTSSNQYVLVGEVDLLGPFVLGLGLSSPMGEPHPEFLGWIGVRF